MLIMIILSFGLFCLDSVNLTTRDPLNGIYYIDPAGGTNTFTTFTAAINSLNINGVGSGGVTFIVADSTFTEAFPAITYNGTATTQATFIAASDSRTKPILMPLAGVGTLDAILTFSGCDYVTLDGFDIRENPANTDGITQMEFGINVKNNGAADGASHNTIVNCDITLSGASVTRGVYQNAITPGSNEGTNSYNKYYDNDLVDCYYGYYLNGNSTYYDQSNEVGAVTDGSITGCIQGVNYNYQLSLQIYNQDIVLIGGEIPANAYAVYGSYGANNTVAVYGNNISQASQSTASSYDIYGIYIAANTSANIHDNLIHGFSSTGTTAYIYGIYLSQGDPMQINYIYNNDVYDISTSSSYIYAMRITPSAQFELHDNNVYNITNTYSSTFYGYYIGANSTLCSANVYDNTVHDINNIQSAYGMYIYYGNVMNTYNNRIYNITTSSNSTLYGLYIYNGTSTSVKNTYNNEIHGLSGGGTIYALDAYNGATQNVYKNKVYDITYTGTGTSVLYGAYLFGSATTTINFYNNFIYDLKSPGGTSTTSSINGIYTSAANTINLWHNTVYLNAAGTSEIFSSNALYLYSGTLVDLRNNIFVNKSTPGSSGITASFRKGGNAGSFTNISATTNNNIFYAGDPGVTNLIYYDTGNPIQTITEYKTLIATKDQQSETEDVPFVSGTNPIDLHIEPFTYTCVESRGTFIADVTDDIDGDIRYGQPGYSGSGLWPDIGADEGEFDCTPPLLPPSAFTATATTTNQINLSAVANMFGDQVLVAWSTTGIFGNPIVGQFNPGDSISGGGTVLYTGPAENLPNHVGLDSFTTYYYRIWSSRQVEYLVYSGAYLSAAATTLVFVPTAPENVNITKLWNDINLSWEAVIQSTTGIPLEIDNYIIYTCSSQNGVYNLLGFTVGGNTSYTIVNGAVSAIGFYIIISFAGTNIELINFLNEHSTYPFD